jgi:hypothetical protein
MDMRASTALALAFMGLTLPLRAFDYAGRWGVTGSLGADTLAMGDVNDTLSRFNGKLDAGWEADLGLSYGFTSRTLAKVSVGEIFDEASFHGGTISLPALSFMAGGEYVIVPKAFGSVDVGIGGGVEYDVLDGNTSVDPGVIAGGTTGARARTAGWAGTGGGGGAVPTGTAPSGATYVLTNCQGQTVGGQITLNGRFFATPQFAVGLEAGYRYAHVYNVIGTTNGVSGPESESVDYSGLISKLSGSYYF